MDTNINRSGEANFYPTMGFDMSLSYKLYAGLTLKHWCNCKIQLAYTHGSGSWESHFFMIKDVAKIDGINSFIGKIKVKD